MPVRAIAKKGPVRVNRITRQLADTREEHLTPGSSNVIGGTYYPYQKVARVRFKRVGKLVAVYEYFPVSAEEWQGFKTATSAGRYVHQTLEPKVIRQVA